MSSALDFKWDSEERTKKSLLGTILFFPFKNLATEKSGLQIFPDFEWLDFRISTVSQFTKNWWIEALTIKSSFMNC